MEEKQKGLILKFINNWTYKDFALGGTLSSQGWNEFREYYLFLSLGFWQLIIGFRI